MTTWSTFKVDGGSDTSGQDVRGSCEAFEHRKTGIETESRIVEEMFGSHSTNIRRLVNHVRTWPVVE